MSTVCVMRKVKMRLALTCRDSHLCRPEYTIVQKVALLYYANYLAFGYVGIRFMRNRFVKGGIECLILRSNFADTFLFEYRMQLALHQSHPFDPWLLLEIVRKVLKRPVDIVQDRQQTADEQRVAVLGRFRLLALASFLIVRKFSRSSAPLVEIVLRLGLAFLKSFLEGVRVFSSPAVPASPTRSDCAPGPLGAGIPDSPIVPFDSGTIMTSSSLDR